jgi:hypothetical protein
MLICMRTTLDLDDRLVTAVKRLAADTGRTMTDIIEDALRAALRPPPARRRQPPWRWVTVKGRAAPAVDIADRDRLYDVMDGGR